MVDFAPLKLIEMAALADWMDYNGHMNVAHYTSASDMAMDVFLTAAGLGKDYAAQGAGSMFVLQQQFHYLKEIRQGETFEITAQVLDVDDKRFHVFLSLQEAGASTGTGIATGAQFATCELLAIHVDMKARKSAPMPDAARKWIEDQRTQHQALPRPNLAGHKISLDKQ